MGPLLCGFLHRVGGEHHTSASFLTSDTKDNAVECHNACEGPVVCNDSVKCQVCKGTTERMTREEGHALQTLALL